MVPDENTEHLPVADSLGYPGIESPHEHIELVGRFPVGVVADLVGSGDEDSLDQGALGVEAGVELVGFGLLLVHRPHLVGRPGGDATGHCQRRQDGQEDSEAMSGSGTNPVVMQSNSPPHFSSSGSVFSFPGPAAEPRRRFSSAAWRLWAACFS